MSNRELSADAKLLIEARGKIADEASWWGYKSPNYLNNPNALCAMQAIWSMTGMQVTFDPDNQDYRRLARKLDSVAKKRYGKITMKVNDDIGHKAVIQIYDEAIQEELNKVPETVDA